MTRRHCSLCGDEMDPCVPLWEAIYAHYRPQAPYCRFIPREGSSCYDRRGTTALCVFRGWFRLQHRVLETEHRNAVGTTHNLIEFSLNRLKELRRAICFLFKSLNISSHLLNFKKSINGPILLFKTIFRYFKKLFPVVVC